MPWLVEADLRMCHVPELFYVMFGCIIWDRVAGYLPGTWCESPSRLCGFFSNRTKRGIGRGSPGKMVPVKYIV